MEDMEIALIMEKSEVPFLGADDGIWINADGKFFSIKSMDSEYRENAYNYLIKQEENIKRGLFLPSVKYDKKYEQDILDFAKKAYKRKLKELEKYMD